MTRTRARWTLAAMALAAAVLATGCTAVGHPDPGEVGAATAVATATTTPTPNVAPEVATVAGVFSHPPVFGVSLPQLTATSLAAAASSAQCQPGIVNRFASVASGISLQTLQATPGTPMLSLEPWHSGQGPMQSDFTLAATISGQWDARYRQVAQSIVAYRKPVLVRFAHEMNGDWYPWAMTNGNTAAQFVTAWRHVVQLFRSVGATNVLWIWSPNIIRGASSTRISQFWPGDAYVDIVGLTGYGVREISPDLTFAPTLSLVSALTKKQVMLTETGAEADSSKNRWISALGDWLAQHSKVLGFVWFQNGTGDDWRFDDTQANLASFKKSLKTAHVSC